MAGLAIRFEDQGSQEDKVKKALGQGTDEDVKIIWKGKKIAKVVFASGKQVVFEE